MKFQLLLPLAALGSALVLPDEQTFSELTVESRHKAESVLDQLYHTKDKAIKFIQGTFKYEEHTADQLFDEAVAQYENDNEFLVSSFEDQSVTAAAWAQYSTESLDAKDEEPPHPPHDGPPGPPHHGPPGRGPPFHRPGPPAGPPHHGPPPPGKGKRPHHPHHPPHHGKPNLTIYELISKSKYTTKLAELINEDEDLVKLLNGTNANYTIFAPTDYAFSKIPKHAPKPSKELIKKVLLYHVAPGLFPAGRILFDKTVPTELEVEELGGPQRIQARVGLKGVVLNLYSRVIAVNIPATNGIIHGLDSILIPPPPVHKILGLLPGEFSTLLYGLSKTGIANTSVPHVGATVFAPTNSAFRKLGPRVNAFLFSSVGTKYLKALLSYHISVNQTVYSTAYYKHDTEEKEIRSFSTDLKKKGGCHHKGEVDEQTFPYFHFDLPTLLEGRILAVDIGRYGPFVEIKVNAFNRVSLSDVPAKDGVIHLPERVIIPPKTVPGTSALSYWQGDEMTVSDLKERLAPFVDNDAALVNENIEL